MASTELAKLTGRYNRKIPRGLGGPDVIYLAKPKGLRNIRKKGTVLTALRKGPPGSGITGARIYNEGMSGKAGKGGYMKTGPAWLKSEKINQTPPRVKPIPAYVFKRNPLGQVRPQEANIFPTMGRTQRVKDFARSANLTLGANAANILNKIAHWGQAESKIVPGYNKMAVAKAYGVFGAGALGAVGATAGAVYVGKRLTPGGRAVQAHKKKVKIAKKNGKAALKAQKMNEKQKLRSSKAVKPMKGASGRGVAKGKGGQSGGGRKNFRPRRDGNGKFAGSY